ncbi:Myelin-oligodendrocyte glycoprotein [Collichthys lucidus]|uniref:Myelin-oligodendrocyte glycoprotein n=1 Tax=Collichthys lucidus TaxID=240159 RepID=A0A4U5VXB0_COLLU|nr:Myelin-oligodendrocyte glycoprotein [Collichthys lucidus]
MKGRPMTRRSFKWINSSGDFTGKFLQTSRKGNDVFTCLTMDDVRVKAAAAVEMNPHQQHKNKYINITPSKSVPEHKLESKCESKLQISSNAFTANLTPGLRNRPENKKERESETIRVSVGEDVILPCNLTRLFDMSTLTVEWTRDDEKDVHVYRKGVDLKDQDENFRDRTSLFREEMRSGNVSLKLTNVTELDEGKYTCKVRPENFPEHFTACSMTLAGISTGAIVGVSFSIVVVGICVGIILLMNYRKINLDSHLENRTERHYVAHMASWLWRTEALLCLMSHPAPVVDKQPKKDSTEPRAMARTQPGQPKKDSTEDSEYYDYMEESQPEMDQLTCPKAVEATVGGNVTLDFHFKSQRNVAGELIEWKFNNSVHVLVYRSGGVSGSIQADRFKSRASLESTDNIAKGKLAVKISSLTNMDAGTYSCFVGPHQRVIIQDLTPTPKPHIGEHVNPAIVIVIKIAIVAVLLGAAFLLFMKWSM